VGQIKPLAVGQAIVSQFAEPATLTHVRVYRGLASQKNGPKAYSAARRQNAQWERDSRVKVVSRPLRYPREWPGKTPQEKGVDVSLAVDFVTYAVMGAYDVGVLMSLDTDLFPALESVHNFGSARHGFPRPEVAAWKVAGHDLRRLNPPGLKIPCRWLTEQDYPAIEDSASYTGPLPSSRF